MSSNSSVCNEKMAAPSLPLRRSTPFSKQRKQFGLVTLAKATGLLEPSADRNLKNASSSNGSTSATPSKQRCAWLEKDKENYKGHKTFENTNDVDIKKDVPTLCGTYAVSERDGVTVLPYNPGEETWEEIENRPRKRMKRCDDPAALCRDPFRKNSPFRIARGHKVDVVAMNNGVAKLARGQGYIVECEKKLAKVGELEGRSSQLEAMLHSIKKKKKEVAAGELDDVSGENTQEEVLFRATQDALKDEGHQPFLHTLSRARRLDEEEDEDHPTDFNASPKAKSGQSLCETEVSPCSVMIQSFSEQSPLWRQGPPFQAQSESSQRVADRTANYDAPDWMPRGLPPIVFESDSDDDMSADSDTFILQDHQSDNLMLLPAASSTLSIRYGGNDSKCFADSPEIAYETGIDKSNIGALCFPPDL